MRAIRWVGMTVLVGLSLAVSATALNAKDEPSTPAMPKPGPEHDLLKKLEGVWDGVIKMEMAPGQVTTSKGVETSKVGIGGFWLVSDYRGEFAGQPFIGHGYHGFDQIKKKYISSWIDSMGSYHMISEGTADKDGKVLTLECDAPDMTGKPAKWKMVTEFKNENSRQFIMSLRGEDGKYKTVMTIDYTRRPQGKDVQLKKGQLRQLK